VRVVLRIGAVSMLVLALGLHWALLQTVAWTGMLITYAHDGSFREAVAKTFDGKHPCPLCKIINEGRALGKGQELQPVKHGFELDPGVIWQATEFDFTCDVPPVSAPDSFAVAHTDEPPKPPPRGAFSDPPASV
jgi:hypothetical protein